jgi:rsbT co-antagonist protein RsbR
MHLTLLAVDTESVVRPSLDATLVRARLVRCPRCGLACGATAGPPSAFRAPRGHAPATAVADRALRPAIGDDTGSVTDETTAEALAAEVERLRRRVEELEGPARRYMALTEGGAVSVQVFDPHGRTTEVNRAWERFFNLTLAELAGWTILGDVQVQRSGLLAVLEPAFQDGRAAVLPTIRYDPAESEIGKGSFRWIVSSVHPVRDASGAVQEVLMLHNEVGDLVQREEDLFAEARRLEAAVAGRTAELEQQLRVVAEQSDAIVAMSTPVLQLWDGLLALPLVGRIDDARARLLQESLLTAIVATRSDQVLLDLTGVSQLDAAAAGSLRDVIHGARLLGARCALTGVSPRMAETLVALDLRLGELRTFANLRDGLYAALAGVKRRKP